MSEASARMHLRDHVREDDVDMALKVKLFFPLVSFFPTLIFRNYSATNVRFSSPFFLSFILSFCLLYMLPLI